MPKRIANTQLNGRTIDILNVIRSNASLAYQQNIPELSDAQGIPKVGEVLYGNPTLCNEFIEALVNRIAMVRIKSAVFNNPYKDLKKGYLEFGSSIEEVFTELIQAVEYSPEKAGGREFKRNVPDVKSAFHVVNWMVLYPITIQRESLRKAFLSEEGVQDLITSILNQVYTSAEYDEFLLFKYCLVKQLAAGKAYPVPVDMSNIKNAATAFRGYSNLIRFVKDEYNVAHVRTNTPLERQQIFMDAKFNAKFDTEVLASAFNLDRATFISKLRLLDDWVSFDNERFEVIRQNSEGIEEVTAAELSLLADVKAVLVDEDWFQIYDKENVMTSTPVASGLYWNYFYHTHKIVSTSPFSNILCFIDNSATTTAPATVTYNVAGVVKSDVSTVVNLVQVETGTLANTNVVFTQDQTNTTAGVAVHPYGSFIVPLTMSGTPAAEVDVAVTPKAEINGVTYTGTTFHTTSGGAGASAYTAVKVGDTITLTKDA